MSTPPLYEPAARFDPGQWLRCRRWRCDADHPHAGGCLGLRSVARGLCEADARSARLEWTGRFHRSGPNRCGRRDDGSSRIGPWMDCCRSHSAHGSGVVSESGAAMRLRASERNRRRSHSPRRLNARSGLGYHRWGLRRIEPVISEPADSASPEGSTCDISAVGSVLDSSPEEGPRSAERSSFPVCWLRSSSSSHLLARS